MGNPDKSSSEKKTDKFSSKDGVSNSTPKIKLRVSGSSRKESSKSNSSKKMKGNTEVTTQKRDKLSPREDILGLSKKDKPINKAEARLNKLVKRLSSESANASDSKKQARERAAEIIEKYCSVDNLKVKAETSIKMPVARVSEALKHSTKKPSKVIEESQSTPTAPSSKSFKYVSPSYLAKDPIKRLCRTSGKFDPSDESLRPTSSKDVLRVKSNNHTYLENVFKRKSCSSPMLQQKFNDLFESEDEYSPKFKKRCEKHEAPKTTVHSERLKKIMASHLSKLSEKTCDSELQQVKAHNSVKTSPSSFWGMDLKTKESQQDPSWPSTEQTHKDDKPTENVSEKVSSLPDVDMEMDWEPVPEELVLSDIHSMRANHEFNEDIAMDVDMDQQDGLLNIEKEMTSSVVHIVIDTNVFISYLVFVKELVSSKIKGMKVQIVIPWQVLRELDHLKNRSSEKKVAGKAHTASTYLLSLSSSANKSIYFQSRKEELKEVDNFIAEIPDDYIIKCCLQLQSHSHNVVLLTNDQNLRLKCAACKIVAASCQEIMSIYKGTAASVIKKYPIELKPPKGGTLASVLYSFANKFNFFLTTVIIHNLKDLYSNMWLWFAPSKPPWNLRQTIRYATDLLPKFEEELAVQSKVSYLKTLDEFFSTTNHNNIAVQSFRSNLEVCRSFCKTMPAVYEHILQPFLCEFKALILDSPEFNRAEDQSCDLVVTTFQVFETNMKSYCEKLPECLEAGTIDPQELKNNIIGISSIIKSLKAIELIPCGQVTFYSHGVVEIHSTLLTFLKSKVDNKFTVDVLVSFCNHKGIRKCLPVGIQCFEKLLKTMKTFSAQLK